MRKNSFMRQVLFYAYLVQKISSFKEDTLKKFQEIIKSIWANNLLTNNGPLHDKFEKKLINYLNTKNVTLFSNGHLALDIAIKSLNLTGEVITTPFTFTFPERIILDASERVIML